jgi:hypothetical protein
MLLPVLLPCSDGVAMAVRRPAIVWKSFFCEHVVVAWANQLCGKPTVTTWALSQQTTMTLLACTSALSYF